MSGMKKIICILVVLVIGVAVQSQVLAQNRESSANVSVAKAFITSIAPQSTVPGTVVSRNDAKLAAEVTGRLIDVSDVGTVVKSGDVVAIIEDTQLLLKRDEQRAEVNRAQARLKFLENEEKRFVTLAESNLAAATKLDETRSDRDVSRGDLQVARSRLAQIEDQLSRTRITAPFGGIVVERLMMPGERVNTGSDVVRLVDQQHLEVIARAPLDYFSFVRPKQVLVIKTETANITGTVRTVVAIGSENTHQFELRLDIEANRFPVGQTVRVSVPVSNARQALVVPRDALVLRPEGITVFVIDKDNKARQVAVTTGVGTGDNIEVNGDIEDGAVVVIRGNERLTTGQSVSIMQG